jgi:hypothetical protein
MVGKPKCNTGVSEVFQLMPSLKDNKMTLEFKRPAATLLASALFAASLMPATFHTASAKQFETVRINSEGFRKCKALGDSGYTAVVRGRSLYNTTRNGDFGQFNIRTCFQTKAACAGFVSRVPNIIRGVFDIQYRACTARG